MKILNFLLVSIVAIAVISYLGSNGAVLPGVVDLAKSAGLFVLDLGHQILTWLSAAIRRL